MNDLKRLEYTRDLNESKKKLENALKELNEKIEDNQNNCEEHVTLIMRAPEGFPYYGHKFRCLFCGQYTTVASKLSVDVRNYLNEVYDDMIDSQREEKFDLIQTMAIGIMRSHPEMSKEEFVCAFNKIISHESINNDNKMILKNQNN